MTTLIPKPRWYRLTSDRLLLALLIVECLLKRKGYSPHRTWFGILPFAGLFLVCGCTDSAKDKFAKGVSAYQNGDHDKAIADYTEAIRLEPEVGPGVLQPRRGL